MRPGPVTKLVAIVLRSMCSRETPATPAAPTPSGRRKPNAFADAILTASFRLVRILVIRVYDYDSLGGRDGLYVLTSWLTRRRAKPKSSTTMTTAQSGTDRSTQVMVVPHFAIRLEDEEEWG